MTNQSTAVKAFATPLTTIGQVRALRQEIDQHKLDDRNEFAKLALEQIRIHDDLKLQVEAVAGPLKLMAANQQTILHALGLSAAHGHKPKRRHRSVAMMGSTELIWKVGGAITGLMVIWKMVVAAWPHIVTAAIAAATGIWHALQAINHIATQ